MPTLRACSDVTRTEARLPEPACGGGKVPPRTGSTSRHAGSPPRYRHEIWIWPSSNVLGAQTGQRRVGLIMPFTTEQFLNVFVEYNAAIWPAQIGMYILGLIAIAALWIRKPLASRLILFILVSMWAWNAIGYHFLFFSDINPAAKVFAGFFMLQAMLFAMCAIATQCVAFQVGRDFRSVAGLALIIYAMAIYPVLGIKAGHGLMLGPMFGVAPCPTTIFAIGMLMLARGPWVVWLSVIPLLWSMVGLAAALQLGIPEDLGLPIAGFLLLVVMAAQRFGVGSPENITTRPTGPFAP